MKLFLSFTTILGVIARNEVTQEDLDTGLYYFGCVRSHAYHPDAEGERDERSWVKEGGVAAHEKLVKALERAEAEGRCRWHRPDAATRLATYPTLNELLVANGVSALKPKHEFEEYSYPAVRDYMAEIEGVQPEVVF
jgi:hypothetical protein